MKTQNVNPRGLTQFKLGSKNTLEIINMKRILAIMLTISFLMPVCAAVLTTEEAARLLNATEIGEDGGLGYSTEDAYYKLPKWIQGNSRLDVIREFLGDSSQMKNMPRLVQLIAKYSSDEEFLQVSIEVLHGFSDGRADEKTLEKVLMPGEDKSGLLYVTFRDGRVITALQECLKRLPPENSLVIDIHSILSGEAAKEVLGNEFKIFPVRYMPLAAAALKSPAPTHGRPSSSDLEGDDLHSQADSPARNSHGFWPLFGKKSLWLWLLAIPVILLIWYGLRHKLPRE